MHFKDAGLDSLAGRANVAQFVSFDPTLAQRFAHIYGYQPNHRFETLEAAVRALLSASPEKSVNVRSFDPANPKSREFLYGLRTVDVALAAVKRLGSQGLHTIVNETIDIADGGVSGVLLGDVIEFAPGDTPRCVEKPGTASLPRAFGLDLLARVYGFSPALNFDSATRVEFSLHPLRRGCRHGHTIVWEIEEVGDSHADAAIRWPNRFSRFVGDKAFGLLVADLVGLPVPETTVISRGIAPFRFGRPTGSETWLRTCPREQAPGHYTTIRGWCDPFALMAAEDPSREIIAAIIVQAGVEATYSGAALCRHDGGLTVEGTAGFGDSLMLGREAPSALPGAVVAAVEGLAEQAAARLGPVRFEWVADRDRVWVVQLHVGASASVGRVIFPGEPSSFRRFDVTLGLEALRELVAEASATGEGITLVGDVGVTSHFGDVLRRAAVPSYIDHPTEQTSAQTMAAA